MLYAVGAVGGSTIESECAYLIGVGPGGNGVPKIVFDINGAESCCMGSGCENTLVLCSCLVMVICCCLATTG